MVMRKKKSFFTKVGEIVRGEPQEVTRARQKSFSKARAQQAVRVGREKAKIQADAQLRRERDRFKPQKASGTGSSLFGFNPVGSPPFRASGQRRRKGRVRRVRQRLDSPRDDYFDFIGY